MKDLKSISSGFQTVAKLTIVLLLFFGAAGCRRHKTDDSRKTRGEKAEQKYRYQRHPLELKQALQVLSEAGLKVEGLEKPSMMNQNRQPEPTFDFEATNESKTIQVRVMKNIWDTVNALSISFITLSSDSESEKKARVQTVTQVTDTLLSDIFDIQGAKELRQWHYAPVSQGKLTDENTKVSATQMLDGVTVASTHRLEAEGNNRAVMSILTLKMPGD